MDESSTSETTPAPTPTPPSRTIVYAVAAVVILALLGGAYGFKHQIKTALMGQPQTSQTSQTPQTSGIPAGDNTTVEKQAIVEVDYTNSGFSPASVTIKKGGTVKFVNKASNSMSVASNPHPTHTDYPGFDQGKSSQNGQNEYDFIFGKVGTWGYHNHLNSSDGGTVVVTD